MEHVYSFQRLEVWHDGRKLVKLTYELSAKFPTSELYGLTNQMRRASVSIISNISEGSGRLSAKDQANFFQMAYSSCLELITQYYIAFDLGYVDGDSLNIARLKIHEVTNKLNALRKKILTSTHASTPKHLTN